VKTLSVQSDSSEIIASPLVQSVSAGYLSATPQSGDFSGRYKNYKLTI
jgi:hypothetical protein